MDSLPPNDPNRNSNNNNNNHSSSSAAAPVGKQVDGEAANDNGRPMDVMGDLRDSPFVAVMFMIGVVTYFLQETCPC